MPETPRYYRAYPLNARNRLKGAEWIEAADDEDAKRRALSLCDPGTPAVEVWQGTRLVGQFRPGADHGA
jgi:hypothetical protein